MKQLMALLLAAGLAMGLTGCTPQPSEPSSAAPTESGSSSRLENSLLPEENYDSIEEVPDFYIQVLMMYGAEEDPETQELRPLTVSLYASDRWTGPELTSAQAVCWFTGFIDGLSTEEKEERYASPLGENQGWFYPQDELEATLSLYFEGVDPQLLRSDPACYSAEYKGYHLGGAPGIGECPLLQLGEVRSEDDLRILPVYLDYESAADRRMELTIRIAPDRKSYQFVSWLPAQGQSL